MEKQLKIGTWNLCLGLGNKKDTVTRCLNELNIGICCLQETEVTNDMQENLLNCGNYNIELEDNTVKKRAGIYIRSDINYIRRNDLEEQDSHIVIIDVVTVIPIRIVCIYRSFRPQGGSSPESLFVAQLRILSKVLVKNCFILGDFNLDVRMELRPDYAYNECCVPFKYL